MKLQFFILFFVAATLCGAQVQKTKGYVLTQKYDSGGFLMGVFANDNMIMFEDSLIGDESPQSREHSYTVVLLCEYKLAMGEIVDGPVITVRQDVDKVEVETPAQSQSQFQRVGGRETRVLYPEHPGAFQTIVMPGKIAQVTVLSNELIGTERFVDIKVTMQPFYKQGCKEPIMSALFYLTITREHIDLLIEKYTLLKINKYEIQKSNCPRDRGYNIAI